MNETKTVVLESRIDIRYLAALTKYFEEKDMLHKTTRGTIASLSLTTFTEWLIALGKAEIPETYELALEFLTRRGLAPMSRGLKKTLIKKLVEEDLMGTDPEGTPVDQGKVDEAVEKVKEKLKGGKDE